MLRGVRGRRIAVQACQPNNGEAMSDSYARGDTSAALLEETIGANLDRTVARFGVRLPEPTPDEKEA